jgi:hypothetical protein
VSENLESGFVTVPGSRNGEGFVRPTLRKQESELYKLDETQSVAISERAENENIYSEKTVLYEDLGEFKDLQGLWRFCKGWESYQGSWNSTFFTNNGQCVAVWVKDNDFCMFDVETKTEIKNFERIHKHQIIIFQQSPSGRHFLTCDLRNHLLIWGTVKWKILYAFQASSKNSPITAAAWSPCEEF